MASRPLVLLGFGGFILFWMALFGLAALRPDYSHLHNAVSELGVLRAPNMLAWNVLGFGLPGLAFLLFGWQVGRRQKPAGIIMPALLAATGASLLFSGLFPADLADRGGLLTQLHIAASMLGLLWIPGALWFCASVRRSWPAALWITAAVIAAFIASILFTDPLPRGLGQRIRFAAALPWYPLMALLIATDRGRRAQQAR
jgi:hypothetical membrane protein